MKQHKYPFEKYEGIMNGLNKDMLKIKKLIELEEDVDKKAELEKGFEFFKQAVTLFKELKQ